MRIRGLNHKRYVTKRYDASDFFHPPIFGAHTLVTGTSCITLNRVRWSTVKKYETKVTLRDRRAAAGRLARHEVGFTLNLYLCMYSSAVGHVCATVLVSPTRRSVYKLHSYMYRIEVETSNGAAPHDHLHHGTRTVCSYL